MLPFLIFVKFFTNDSFHDRTLRASATRDAQPCLPYRDLNGRGNENGILTHQLWERRRLPVKHDGSFLHTGPQLKQAVQGQRGHMGFAPSFPTLLHFFFKLYPPRKMRLVRQLQELQPSLMAIPTPAHAQDQHFHMSPLVQS